MVSLTPSSPAGEHFRAAVGHSLARFLDGRAATLAAIGAPLDAFTERARAFTSGGKRLRPAFCAWGWAAASGSLDLPDAVLTAAASLDLLHVSALIHDDVMDASDYRRGLPAAHRQFEADHRAHHGRGEAEAFGRAGAILFGDMLLVWSDEMLTEAGLSADELARTRPWVQAVRTEVTAGQYLDVLAQATDPYQRTRTPDAVAELEALVSHVVTYKTACYSIERPLNIGAAIAGASAEQQAALTAFGRPLGRAFQWRDDVLGVFGDEALTGKESGEDLREGKLTLLAVRTLAQASAPQARRFADLFGRPDLTADDVAELRGIITDSGALAQVEQAIHTEYAAALSALDAGWPAPARDGLEALASAAVKREF